MPRGWLPRGLLRTHSVAQYDYTNRKDPALDHRFNRRCARNPFLTAGPSLWVAEVELFLLPRLESTQLAHINSIVRLNANAQRRPLTEIRESPLARSLTPSHRCCSGVASLRISEFWRPIFLNNAPSTFISKASMRNACRRVEPEGSSIRRHSVISTKKAGIFWIMLPT